MAISFTQGNDFIIPTENDQTYLGLAGNDTYILSTTTVAADATFVISDTEGANKIQLVDGLEITSSSVTNDAVELTLSNGAKVQILGASSFGYEVGANITAGDTATSQTYDDFVTGTLLTTVPAAGEPAAEGGTVVVPDSSTPATPTFSVAASEATVTEGGTATFTVSLSAAQGTATTVAYALAGTGGAVLGTDTTTVADATLTFAPGEVSKTVTVPVTFDTTAETGEGMTLTLSAPSTGTVLGTATADVAFADSVAPTFTLTSDAVAGAATEEGQTITYTITPDSITDKAYTFTLSTLGDTVGGVATAATAADFSPASQTITFAAGTTEAQTVVQTIVNDGSSEGLEGYKTSLLDSSFKEVATSTGIITDPTSGTGTGTTYTLTTTTDNVPGTTGNDTIIGDLGTTVTVQGSDQINGGAGTDTYNIYGAFTAGTSATGVVTNVETLSIATVADAAQVFTSLTKAATGIENIVIEDASLLGTATITTTAGQSLSLATGSSNGSTAAGTETWAASATDTTLNLTLNGFQGSSTGTDTALTITGALATTQNLASTGAANAVPTLTLAATTDKLVVTGDQMLTVATNVISGASATKLLTIDASATTGGTNIALAAATNAAFVFKGGSGTDAIKFADNALASLTSGAQLDGGAGSSDKLGITDTALTAAELSAINAVTNFEVLGLNADITLDGSSLTSVKSFAVDTAALTDVISNMATGATVALNASSTAQTYSSSVGVSDLAVNIGSSTSAAITSTALTIGQTAVALSSNGATGVTNVITTLANADNSVYTLTGAAGLTITNATAATSTGSKFDASAMTGALTIKGNGTAFAAGSGLGDILIGGSAADTITSSVNGATMTGNAGADTFDISVALGGTSSTALLPAITDFTKGDIVKFAAFNGTGVFTAAKLDVSGAANLAAALDLAAAGTSGATNSTVKWFNYGSDTYIVEDNTDDATFAATDIAVKLTGTLDLSTSTFTEASDTLTFA
ncbi:MAG: hypothetical protein GY737_15975 [Desulfobacteraceae bacterium]|nr:hypothetical protein [Desulfobacteraceae bacterium]